MAKFKITWLKTGVEEIVNQADRDTVEGYIDCRFGANFDPKVAKVELVGAKKEIEEEVPVVTKPKK
jgi:hypothetical protein